jgi:hypothetical protein
MKRYTANELKAIRRLSEAITDDDVEITDKSIVEEPLEENQEDSEEGLAFSADDFLSALQGSAPEEPIEKRIENSYIQRSQIGYGLFKLHGKTTPKRIFW